MTIYELLELFVSDDQLVRIWDNNSEQIVFEGEICEVPDMYNWCEVTSIDSMYKKDFDGYITFNINVEEDENNDSI